jgi:formyltetrahydrofolate synthetase
MNENSVASDEPERPAAEEIDIDAEGRITGLF